MKVRLGILVNLGTSTAVEVKPTTPGAVFAFPARVFIVGGEASVGVTVDAHKVTFNSLDNNLVRVIVAFDTPDEQSRFAVTYTPSVSPTGENAGIFVWNSELAPEPDETNSTFWDRDAEKAVDLSGARP